MKIPAIFMLGRVVTRQIIGDLENQTSPRCLGAGVSRGTTPLAYLRLVTCNLQKVVGIVLLFQAVPWLIDS
jgi:hypothetical protein